MTAPVILVRALPTVVRAVAKPAVFKRFLGTRAGKRAILKYGTMLVKSKDVQKSVGNIINRAGNTLKRNADYKKSVREYEKLQNRVDTLEKRLAHIRNNDEKISELTFTLGRNVVEMQQLLAQMQALYQQTLQQQMAMATTRTR